MEYREFGPVRIDEIDGIYRANQWTSYLGDRDSLVEAFDRALYVLEAFEDGKLVGFVRFVGDGEVVL